MLHSETENGYHRLRRVIIIIEAEGIIDSEIFCFSNTWLVVLKSNVDQQTLATFEVCGKLRVFLDTVEIKLDSFLALVGKLDPLSDITIQSENELPIAIKAGEPFHVTGDGLKCKYGSLSGAIPATRLDSANQPVHGGCNILGIAALVVEPSYHCDSRGFDDPVLAHRGRDSSQRLGHITCW